jgi:hypothetical protein
LTALAPLYARRIGILASNAFRAHISNETAML